MLTNFVGGALHPNALDHGDDALVAATVNALRQPLGLRLQRDTPPAFAAVRRWPRAIPQYTIGQLDRVATVERALDECSATRNLVLAGNYMTGVSVNDTISNAMKAVGILVDRLGGRF